MPTIKIDLPRVHMAGLNAHHNAHIEVGQHGFALFLAPDAEYPLLDIDGTPTQLDDLVRDLKAALESRALDDRATTTALTPQAPPVAVFDQLSK